MFVPFRSTLVAVVAMAVAASAVVLADPTRDLVPATGVAPASPAPDASSTHLPPGPVPPAWSVPPAQAPSVWRVVGGRLPPGEAPPGGDDGAVGTGDGPQRGEGCRWAAPVAAPVSDPFRPPPGPYGPGNRGIEYATVAGDPVLAVAGGAVGFVGPVGGSLFVVVEHPSGVRSTVGPLVGTEVVRGQQVAGGDRLGAAAPRLHLTARLGRRYLDPAPFLAGRCGGPHLVPLPATS